MQVKFRSSSTFAAFQVLSSHARPVPLARIGKPWSAGTVPGTGFLPRGPETSPLLPLGSQAGSPGLGKPSGPHRRGWVTFSSARQVLPRISPEGSSRGHAERCPQGWRAGLASGAPNGTGGESPRDHAEGEPSNPSPSGNGALQSDFHFSETERL